MANHGYVKSKKNMNPQQISDLLERLNQSHFKGNLKVEYTQSEPNSWGEHTWLITYMSPEDEVEYARRVCWLETKRTFEMRHGGGCDFAWWIDNVITNAVALLYDGNISDDGCGGISKGKPDYYPTFIEFLEMMKSHVKKPEIKLWLLQEEMEFCPPEHRVDLGEKIEAKIEWVTENDE